MTAEARAPAKDGPGGGTDDGAKTDGNAMAAPSATRLPPPERLAFPGLKKLIAALDHAGIAFRLVGGCVRDALADRPVKDVDLATPAPPRAVMDGLRAQGIKMVPTGLKHGTVTAVLDGHPFEITTLRRDVETDGRHAVVAFTDDWREDALRRDLTINALSCDTQGRVYDYFGGIEDLRAGRIRFVGDAATRIDEDVLRLLRFFRFFGAYGRPPADATALAACRSRMHRLPELSGERLRQEILRILTLDNAADIVALMAELGVLAVILPELGGNDSLRRLMTAHPDAAGGADALLRLGLLLRAGQRQGRTGDDGAQIIASRLRLSRVERTRLKAMQVARPTAGLLTEAELRGLAYRRGLAVARDWLFIAAAEQGAAITPMLSAMAQWQPLRFPLQGADLKGLGVAPGPDMGHLLKQVETWWVRDGCHAARAACLQKAQDILGAAGPCDP